ncbi:MAG TPA: PAC2 family protein [Thermoleophilaceae bacterium]|nr:PAC2 family protein [Thermoleophilaceae bacterium]
MDPLIWSDKPELRDPVLVAAFKGWNDAGESATAAVGFLVESFDATEVARVDPEEFFDFTAVRPTVRLTEGESRAIDWPATVISAARIPGADRDLVFVQGVEPSLRWRTFTGAITTAATELGVDLVLTLGALLADVPHSRDVAVSGLASDQALIDRLGLERTTYEGPTGIVGVLHDACQSASLPSASLWAAVPHYVAAAPNPKAALALVRRFEGIAGVAVDGSALEEASEDYERQVNAAVASDPDVKAFVEKLEETMDAVDDSTPLPDEIPSADAIARDFQRFLRQRRPDEP